MIDRWIRKGIDKWMKNVMFEKVLMLVPENGSGLVENVVQ